MRGRLESIDGDYRMTIPLILILLVLSSFYQGVACSQGNTVISFGGRMRESLEDRDGDGLAEYLFLDVPVNVYEPGTYGLHASMGDDRIVSNFGPEPLDIGTHDIPLKFSGGDISQYGIRGHYSVRLELYSKDPGIGTVVKTSITNGSYDPDSFEAPEGTGRVYVESRGDKVFIKGDVMTVSINRTHPRLSFYYTNDGGKKSLSSVTYTSVIAFRDTNGNGRWDPSSDEKRYEGDLTKVDWKLDLDISSGYDIALYGVIPLGLVGSATAAAWAKMTFRLSSAMMTAQGTSQKFDIDIDLWQPLDADRLALLHILKDETDSRSLETGPEQGSDLNTHVIRIVGESGKTHGTYSWSDDIRVGSTSLSRDGKSTSWFDIQGRHANIWFSYPLGDDILLIHNDPTVGMDPKNIMGSESGDVFLENRPLMMIGGVLLGTVIVIATIYSRNLISRKSRGRW